MSSKENSGSKRKIEEREESHPVHPFSQLQRRTSAYYWSQHYRLIPAIEDAHQDPENNLCVFAVEKNNGKREFIVTNFAQFWCHYSLMKSDERHFYEVIEKEDLCHLYFDLEFSKIDNPNLDGDDLTKRFLSYVFEKVAYNFNITVTKKHVLDLDSTNENKFSRHLIFHFPDSVFRSNRDAGGFVKKICEESGGDFLVQSSKGLTCFVDTGVYSKNQNFRLFLSSKKGKSSVLKRHWECQFDFSHQDIKNACCIYHMHETTTGHSKVVKHDIDELIFYASLITNVTYHDTLRVLTFATDIPPRTPNERTVSRSQRSGEPSPFPLLENFICSKVSPDGASANVRDWEYFQSSKNVVFNISGSRYCRKIKREHQSNHVYFVANLEEKYCYQKCYDPDCRGFRSSVIPIPDDVMATIPLLDLDSDQ